MGGRAHEVEPPYHLRIFFTQRSDGTDGHGTRMREKCRRGVKSAQFNGSYRVEIEFEEESGLPSFKTD